MKTDVIEKIKHIETTYPVEDIEYAGIKLWPFFRNSIFTLYYYSDEKTLTDQAHTNNKLWRFFKAFMETSLLRVLKKQRVIIFTDDMEFKRYNGGYIDRIMQSVFSTETNLMPIILKRLSLKVPIKDYIQSDFVAGFIVLFSKLVHFKEKEFHGEEILRNIIQELDILFNYKKNIRLIIGGLNFYRIYFYFVKPFKIYVNCYYDIMRMPAFYVAKQNHIPVIEMQHGVINGQHIAYTSFKSFDITPYPDYLLVFGDRFKLEISKNIYYKDSVFTVGSYYIDLMRQEADTNKCLFEKKYGFLKDKIIITVASQYDIDKAILTFVEQTAKLDSRLFFVFVPRFVKDYHRSYKNDRIVIETELDIYQCMQNSHVTSAVLSTCAIESLAFGTPVVLMDIDGLAQFAYGKFFEGILSVLYAPKPEGFIGKINEAVQFDRNVVREEGNLFFADNHEERLKKVLTVIG